MSRKVWAVILFGILCLLLIATIFAIGVNAKNAITIRELALHRSAAIEIAHQLRRSSDKLTQMARLYVATNDPRYEAYFYKILDIRDGRAPRPENYGAVYWDFIMSGDAVLDTQGQSASLLSLVNTLELTTHESELLLLAEKHSEHLIRLEKIAFAAMKGVFEDAHGNLVVKKEPDPVLASTLLNGREYLTQKSKIMKPIDQFFRLINERTEQTILAKQEREKTLQIYIIGLVGTGLFLSFILLLIVRSVWWPVIKKRPLQSDPLEPTPYQPQRSLQPRSQNAGLNSANALMLLWVESIIEQLENELQTQEKIFNAIKQNNINLLNVHKVAKIGYWELNFETNEEKWSDTIFDIYGLTKETVPSFSAFKKCIHPDDRDSLLASQEKSVKTGQSFSFDYRIQHSDGTIRYVTSYGSVLLNRIGQPKMIYGLLQDMTDYRKQDPALNFH
ncbi:PAS domain-containing protein [Sneathiella aquimaris]|uniref:PAS domain-containing protein n=1 Tax=Sneathiella aquimaris TaxID=2599305 RepID=UPI00146E237E|nr:PAS domain-containing protein [Sneathiella aquimaris]